MPTKKELEARFNLSDNTVYNTLKASGLDTSKTDYTEDEIKELFEPARKMIDSGMTYRDITEWAKRKEKGSPESATPHDTLSGDDFSEIIRDEVLALAEDAVQEAVREVITHLPEMLRRALQQEAQKGTIRDAFRQSRKSYLGEIRQSFGEYYEAHKKGVSGLPGGIDDTDTFDVDATSINDDG